MSLRRRLGIVAILAALAGSLPAQFTPATALLALSKHDRTLSIVDPATLQVVAVIPVGDDPHEVVASADGRTAYVSNYGFGAFHTLAVIDLVGQKQMPFIDLGALRGPHGLAFVDGKVWFTAEAAKAIGSYNPATGKIDWIMGTGQNRTHMLYVFPGAGRILTANVNSATISILDHTQGAAGAPAAPPPGRAPLPGPPGGDWNETVIQVGRGSEGFDVSPDGREAWVANAGDGTISVIDLGNKSVVATLDVQVPRANRLTFTPDGRQVLVTAGTLVVLDAATRTVVKRLADVHGSGGILMQPDGARAYVACSPDNSVAVIDLKTLQRVGQIPIAGPDGLAWAARP